MAPLCIGTDDFKKYRDRGGYLVDKSQLIREVIDGGEVLLLPRPRRFGKTLNLSMLRYFFDKSQEDRGSLFADLTIAQSTDCMAHQGKYPTLFLTLKDLKGDNWEVVYKKLEEMIASRYKEHAYVLPILAIDEQEQFQRLMYRKGDRADLDTSLKNLIIYLYRYHKMPVVILIDEYDSPIIEAWGHGYYAEMVNFMRAWLGGGLKHEQSQAVFRAVVTGILRVARESLFSDLNNLSVWTTLQSGPFADKFGFTEEEVEQALRAFGLYDRYPEVREWYNGYTFGDQVVYNPWSVMKFIEQYPNPIGPHWLNTSANRLVHEELKAGGLELKRDLEKLLMGEELRYPINEAIVFADIQRDRENIWSFLYFAGYLRAEDPQRDPDDGKLKFRLLIPNREVMEVYRSYVDRYFTDELKHGELLELIRALIEDDYAEFERSLQELIVAVLSYHDPGRYPEAVYHAFMLGLLVNARGSYRILSNVESGYGRADIVLIPRREGLTGKIIELKSVKEEAEVEEALAAAFRQIEHGEYERQLLEAGVKREMVRRVAIVINGKRVRVASIG